MTEYFCPFAPNLNCGCNSGFARNMFDEVVGNLQQSMTREEAIAEYKKALLAKPIIPLEAPQFTSQCNNLATVMIYLKKKEK